jgi:hypothetical protein
MMKVYRGRDSENPRIIRLGTVGSLVIAIVF